jgi:hypothetical protein
MRSRARVVLDFDNGASFLPFSPVPPQVGHRLPFRRPDALTHWTEAEIAVGAM